MSIQYLHFGYQCPGSALESGAREAAEILGLSFSVADVGKEPELARKFRLFFPGAIVQDDLMLVYPGSGSQLAECIRNRGPLPGKQEYRQPPEADPDRVEILSLDNVSDIRGLCIPTELSHLWCEKMLWLKSFNLSCLGLIAYQGDRPVAIMEALPRQLVPYPLPLFRGLFITCLYGRYDEEKDYRRGLIRAGLPLLKKRGCSALGIVAGRDTPYPNGPVQMLVRAGFGQVQSLGMVTLLHRREEQVFMTLSF